MIFNHVWHCISDSDAKDQPKSLVSDSESVAKRSVSEAVVPPADRCGTNRSPKRQSDDNTGHSKKKVSAFVTAVLSTSWREFTLVLTYEAKFLFLVPTRISIFHCQVINSLYFFLSQQLPTWLVRWRSLSEVKKCICTIQLSLFIII